MKISGSGKASSALGRGLLVPTNYQSRFTNHGPTDRFIPRQFLIEYTHFVRPRAPGGPMATLDLRPLSLGEFLDRSFFLYRRHFPLFVGIAAIPYSFFFVLNLTTALIPVFARSDAAGRMPTAGLVGAGIGAGLL